MKKDKLNYLNIGCGNRYHPDWINLDIKSADKNVIEHNILKGIPFDDNSTDVVYHSHVLEHFSKENGLSLIKECYRVLKKNGIIRIVVPDLEGIVKEYLKIISDPVERINFDKHDWILIELFDQTMRNKTGGEMKDFILSRKESEYVIGRIGEEGISIANEEKLNNTLRHKLYQLKKAFYNKLDYIPFIKYYRIGKFRNRGENHYCMYDKFSLTKLLSDIGFKEVSVKKAVESSIPNWPDYNLDFINGHTIKPDSLFIEGKK